MKSKVKSCIHVKYTGPVSFVYQGKNYEANVEAEADDIYEPQTYWEEGYQGIDIDDFNVLDVTDENGNPVPYTDDMESLIYMAIDDLEEWEYPPCEEDLRDPPQKSGVISITSIRGFKYINWT